MINQLDGTVQSYRHISDWVSDFCLEFIKFYWNKQTKNIKPQSMNLANFVSTWKSWKKNV